MRIGTDDRSKLIAAAALMTVALLVTSGSFYSCTSSRHAINAERLAEVLKSGPPRTARFRFFDPRLRYELIKVERYTGSGRNIFLSEPESQPLPTPSREPNPQPPVPVERKAPPGIRLTFFGYALMSGSPRKVFVRHEDAETVFVASEGDVIDRRYRIAKIGSTSLEVEDLLDNQFQTINLRSE